VMTRVVDLGVRNKTTKAGIWQQTITYPPGFKLAWTHFGRIRKVYMNMEFTNTS